MTGQMTATVETLAAEVRVLMVGSRQVTMSVYGQLDRVDAGEIEPFGRVRPKDDNGYHINVVGRRIGSGELVSSWTAANDEDRIRSLALFKLKRELGLDSYSQIPDGPIEAEVARLTEFAEKWSALPLIVLAGLR